MSVLYNNREIKSLLYKRVKEGDEIVARKKPRQQEVTEIERVDRSTDPEDLETFNGQLEDIEVGQIKERKPSLQDLLQTIKQAQLQDALPVAVEIIELAVATILKSAHCE